MEGSYKVDLIPRPGPYIEDQFRKKIKLSKIKKKKSSPGWCGSAVECQPVNQRVAGSIPSLGHMPGLQARSPVEGQVRGNHILMFLSLSFSLPSLLQKVNK